MAAVVRRIVQQPAYRDEISDEEQDTQSASSLEERTSLSSPYRPFRALPVHRGDGRFEVLSDAESSHSRQMTTSLYPSVVETGSEDEFSNISSVLPLDRISWPSSMSATSSSEPRSPLLAINELDATNHARIRRDSSAVRRPLLTQHALSRVNSHDNLAQEATSASDDEEEIQSEIHAPEAPLALSAGITSRPTQLTSRGASGGYIHAGFPSKKTVKRRHRQSGQSDRGSKRSNTSNSRLPLQQITTLPQHRSPSQERKSDSIWRQLQAMKAEEMASLSARYPHIWSHQPLEQLCHFIQSELGTNSTIEAALSAHNAYDQTSDGEETETEQGFRPLEASSSRTVSQASNTARHRDKDIGVFPDRADHVQDTSTGPSIRGALSYWKSLYRFLNPGGSEMSGHY